MKIDASAFCDGKSVAPGITLDGKGVSRVIRVDCSGKVVIRGIAVANGNAEEDFGGGVKIDGARLILVDCVIKKNKSALGGGIFIDEFGELELVDSLIVDNVSTQAGGGVYVLYDEEGSGASGVKLTLTNVAVANNVGGVFGGGLFIEGGEVAVYNSIICSNKQDQNLDVYLVSSRKIVAKASNVLSTFTDWTEGVLNLEYDAKAPLFANAKIGDYTLAPQSQALNKGDNSYVDSLVDLVGNQRIVGAAVDLGAYERQETP